MRMRMIVNKIQYSDDNPQARRDCGHRGAGTKLAIHGRTAIESMPRRGSPTLASLETLFETKRGRVLPLPPNLTRLYGCLRMMLPQSHPRVFSNFVTTLDGIVSLHARGHDGGADISGFSAQDHMVMGLLRAIADVVIVGSGALHADRQHVWTAENIFPGLANDFRRLSAAMGKPQTPLNVVVSGSGEIDLRLPVFASGKVQALIVTTPAGAKRLRRQRAPDSVEIRAVGRSARPVSASAILDQVVRLSSGRLILVEGGPRLLGDFYAEHLLDEQFLTLAPQIAGRHPGDGRPSLVMGKTFAPRDSRWGTLVDARRGDSLLFLRYSFEETRE